MLKNKTIRLILCLGIGTGIGTIIKHHRKPPPPPNMALGSCTWR